LIHGYLRRECRRSATGRCGGGGQLTLDASAVARIDAAGLQLLCAAVAAARSAGRPVSWTAVSDTVIEGARTLALEAALGLSPAAAPAAGGGA
jgi:anti-anti-sigma regulatory factor